MRHGQNWISSCKLFRLRSMQGASYINIPDTVGFTTPEYGAIFKYLIDHVKTDREIIYSPHCHDDLGMAVANSLAAVKMELVVSKEPSMVSGAGWKCGTWRSSSCSQYSWSYYQVESPIVFNETINTSELVSRYSGIPVPKTRRLLVAMPSHMSLGIHQDGVLKNPSYLWNHHPWVGGCQEQ